jgi:hypothetical protein
MSVDLKITDEQMQTYLQHGFVAVAFDKDGQYYDGIYNWETAQTIAREGYNVVAIANDGNMEKEEIQRICKYELSVALDCFGPEFQK